MSPDAGQFQEDEPRLPNIGDSPVDTLLINIEGFEGPIDLLLALARDQKVDLTRISILQLARQYLSFIDRARELRLDLAAEYLVTATWLAYLKSRLLVPQPEPETEEPSGEQLAEALGFQLRRLEAMQRAAEALARRPQLGQTVFPRGMIEEVTVTTETIFDMSLYDLLHAYGDIQRRQDTSYYEPIPLNVMSMEEAVERMTRMLGHLPRDGRFSVWTTLESFLPERPAVIAPEDEAKALLYKRSALASLLTAGLEMVKQGKLEIRQDGLFRPIYLRGRDRDENDD